MTEPKPIGYITEASLIALQQPGTNYCLIYRSNPTEQDIPVYTHQEVLNHISKLEEVNQ